MQPQRQACVAASAHSGGPRGVAAAGGFQQAATEPAA
eukprot:COSAG06_NODE_55755_length_288_cov_0.793651_1_plen_36_part_01